ncbi:MAG: TolC family outer membrane protein [Xanthomonadales bacterium]|nr:TolC family outer membrane protein [Gammaproteobacteria bacterium]NNK04360.1 TolC family outer membrane protein [Xanthomonadales bacterium]NNL00532.1 TolC family outer membrane protein [Xanthomonadales bacterium]
MQFKTRHKLALAATFLVSSPAFAVDLIGVHDLAARNDPALQAAAFRKEATGENERQAWSNLLPSLSGSASQTWGSSTTSVSGTQVDDSDTDNSSWGFSLRQALYDQSNYEQLDIARGQVSQADAIYNIAYQDFLVRVAGSYFAVLTAQDGVIFAEAEEKALQRQFEQAEQRFEVGLTAVTDVHEARASYDNARARAIVSRNNLADTKEALYELTRQYFDDIDPLQEVLPLVKPLPENPAEWVDIAMQYNPSVVAAHKSVEIAEATTRLNRAGHFPTLDLTAGYTSFTNNEYVLRDDFQRPIATTDLTNKDQRIGLQLTVPIYQGGVVSSRTRQSRDLLNAVSEDLEQQQRAVVRATNNAYRAVIAGIEQVGAFNQAMVSAESALEATQAGFEVGTRTIVDVLIAQQRYFQAQRDNSLARHTYVVDHLRLKAAAGVLVADDLAKVNAILE